MGDSKYTSMVKLNAQYFMFTVKAESNALLALSMQVGQTDANAYIIEIGAEDNTKTTIRKVGEDPHSVDSQGILSGMESRAFWITMEDNKIVLGKGHTPGSDVVITKDTPDAWLIKSISIASSNSKVAQWSFASSIGKVV